MMKCKICVINTGGTFSSTQTSSGLAPSLEAKQFLEHFQTDEVALEARDIFSLDSANILPRHWQSLAQAIDDCVATYDGVVVIHGTDTLAYTASMLSFMLANCPIPVVVTGSQLALTASQSDAASNLSLAIKMAASQKSGVYVAFNHKIILGCRSAKVRTRGFDAFESINWPVVAHYDAFGLAFHQEALQLPKGSYAPQTEICEDIGVLKYFPGMNADILHYMIEQDYKGIFIEGVGLGGLPSEDRKLLACLDKAAAADIPIVIGTQCRYEGSNLHIYETGQNLLNCGVIPSRDMTSEAAITKLMWALGQKKGRLAVMQMFDTNLVGEICL